MSQAVIAPSTGAPRHVPGKANNIAVLPVLRRLRADVPPFDPHNSKHISAWETMYDIGRQFLNDPEFAA